MRTFFCRLEGVRGPSLDESITLISDGGAIRDVSKPEKGESRDQEIKGPRNGVILV